MCLGKKIMKRYFIIYFLALITLGTKAQSDLPIEDNWKVVSTNNNKATLWGNLKRWITDEFSSYESTVDMEDKEEGLIIVRFSTYENDFLNFHGLLINMSLQVEVKDNKYRYKTFNSNYQITQKNMYSDVNRLPSNLVNIFYKENVFASISNSSLNIPITIENKKKFINYRFKTTPKYKNTKDEKKGKINEKYQDLLWESQMIKTIESYYKSLINTISQSLEKQMETNNEEW